MNYEHMVCIDDDIVKVKLVIYPIFLIFSPWAVYRQEKEFRDFRLN